MTNVNNMYKSVGAPEHSTLIKMCQTAGLPVDSTTRMSHLAQGRMHAVYLLQTGDSQWIIQRLNRLVIKDLTAFETLMNTVLAPANLTPPLLQWPNSGSCVLEIGRERWIHRVYVKGTSLATRLSLLSFEIVASTLRQFHKNLKLEQVRKAGYIGINPWSGDAGKSMESRLTNSNVMDGKECEVVEQWIRRKQVASESNRQADIEKTVVHRDAKPSNFIQKFDGSLVLIDFDTIGIGDPAMDLGEVLRAWLTADELTKDSNSQEDYHDDSAKRSTEKLSCPDVNSANCIQCLQALQTGYNDAGMTYTRISQAAMQCCLLQCERFLDDHFAGDQYYTVKAHGENLHRARQQLAAMTVLDEIPRQ